VRAAMRMTVSFCLAREGGGSGQPGA
jgi:hypothetical protein